MRSYAVSFARVHSPSGSMRRYPLLSSILALSGREQVVNFLIDSGSDYSILPQALVRGAFGIHPEELPSGETLQGFGGIVQTRAVQGTIRFGMANHPFEETISFLVPKEEDIEPAFAVLGREPFFDRFRVDFRMGYRKEGIEGKFILYRE
jgi:hypothetical protein